MISVDTEYTYTKYSRFNLVIQIYKHQFSYPKQSQNLNLNNQASRLQDKVMVGSIED